MVADLYRWLTFPVHSLAFALLGLSDFALGQLPTFPGVMGRPVQQINANLQHVKI